MSFIINKKNTYTGFKTVAIIVAVCMCIALAISAAPVVLAVLVVVIPILGICAMLYGVVCLIGAGVNVIKRR